MKDYLKIYEEWLNSSLLSNEEKAELLSIKDNNSQIEERFYKDLAFGTGGLRGVMEVGTNRMNRFVIRKASQGLANFLNKKYQNPSVAIAYDSRNHSEEFAMETAATLAANGVKVFIFHQLMPTPALSFATRYYKCNAGVVVTASHNPKIYNGYKVYGPDGCQCTDNLANGILEEIEALDIFKDVKIRDYHDLVDQGLIYTIDHKCHFAYYESTLRQSIYRENKVLNIVYTPLNGAGRVCVTNVLNRDGFEDLSIVSEQMMPDGNFPTCPYPNPEIPEALKLGIRDLLNKNADILVATDPDSDRCGVVVNNHGEAKILTGNEVGLLLFDAIYHAKKESGQLSNNPVLVKTIVSSDMAKIMADSFGVRVIEVLTGFKYIGEQMLYLEQKEALEDYLFGFEESCGYLTNPDVRDKDAVNAVLLICEVANHLKLQGLTLVDKLNELYAKYGDYKTYLATYEFPGVEGMNNIQSIMAMFRSEEIQNKIEGIDHIGDYKLGYILYKDRKEPTNLPISDVIKFFFKDNSTVTIRPSGTEPKLKVYYFANGQNRIDELKQLFGGFIK